MTLTLYSFDDETGEEKVEVTLTIEEGVRQILRDWLLEYDLEGFHEEVADLTPEDAILACYETGRITEEDLERFLLIS